MSANRAQLYIGLAVFLLSGLLLFASLGTYALWDDETETALGAEGVLLTGDTSSIIGHNLVARRAGLNVHNLRDRFTPPLPIYMTAASMAIFGKTSWAARLPFAICGLATVGLMLFMLRKMRAPTLTWVLTGIAILGNVSLFLYFRQARYYGVVIFLTVLIGYLYIYWQSKRWQAILLSLASAALFASHQICFLEVNTVLFIDYVFFRRKEIPLSKLQLPWLLGPQILIIGAVFSVWNPFLTKSEDHLSSITIADRLTLLWWYVRDINQTEFCVGLLLLAGIAAYFLHRKTWILRGLIAMAFMLLVASGITHQTVGITSVADVRYVVPIIPLSIAVGVMTIEAFLGNKPLLATGVALLAFWTNLLHGAFVNPRSLHSTLANYVGELLRPPPEPYTPTYRWVAQNVPEKASVWVVPEHMAYPLMFHAPNPIYAWQLTDRKEAQFANLDPIHFQGVVPPDYIIVFGPFVNQIVQMMGDWKSKGVVYGHVATIDAYWRDLYRPELFWRTFKPITSYDKRNEAIYVFQLRKNP